MAAMITAMVPTPGVLRVEGLGCRVDQRVTHSSSRLDDHDDRDRLSTSTPAESAISGAQHCRSLGD